MLFLCAILLTLLSTIILTVECRGPHHPRGDPVDKHHVHYRPTREAGQKLTQDDQLLHDREHIQEHLEEIIGEPDLSNLTDEELEFYYFQMHDTDRNSKLDGLEILQAIYHTAHHDKHHENDDEYDNNKEVSDDFEYYVELIDKVLREDDKNDDGYLSYAEYVEGRKKEQSTGVREPIVKMIT